MNSPHHEPDRFAFAFTRGFRWAGAGFGVTPESTEAVIDDGVLSVRFGPWRVRTPLENVRDVSITGPYAFLKTAGPARLAITDRGLTFATNRKRGVLLHFRQPIRGIEPTGLLRHPELTLTVADIHGFASAIRDAIA